jgi:sugar O-acyltransferase (sialic acid O-acetyltransferase NeuD family)
MKDLLILGAGGHGKVCISVAKSMNLWENIYFLDDVKIGYINNDQILGKINLSEYDVNTFDVFIAIGDNKNRSILYKNAVELGFNVPNLIHNTAFIDKNTVLNNGNLIMPNSIINSNAKLGKCNIVNSGVIIEHDCRVGDYNHFSPSTTICGNVIIESFCWIGAGTTIINSLAINDDIMVGAGSLVNKNLINPGIYIGVPAKFYKSHDTKKR